MASSKGAVPPGVLRDMSVPCLSFLASRGHSLSMVHAAFHPQASKQG